MAGLLALQANGPLGVITPSWMPPAVLTDPWSWPVLAWAPGLALESYTGALPVDPPVSVICQLATALVKALRSES